MARLEALVARLPEAERVDVEAWGDHPTFRVRGKNFVFSDDTVGTGHDFGSPDGLWADQFGRLFIQTDGAQPTGANDQMLVADPVSGEIRRLFAGVERCEITGIAVTPDQRTMFINVQHPGNGDPALTRFPDYDPALPPRDCTVVITRNDGGIIGS